TVRDSSDAVMSGVKVTVEDVNRGVATSTVTNETGRYSFPNMVVGTYRVMAEMAGFKRWSSSDFELNVNQSLEIDPRMEVGQVTERVEVVAAAQLLQTADSQVGNLIETKRIVDLPLAARDFMQLTLLSAGVSESNGNRRHQTERGTWIGSFSVHGHNPTYNQYLFDGIPGKEAAHQTNIFAPSVDAIQEIKVETANYSAEFGSEAGGHLNVVTRSGTNEFHGVLFEFVRNDYWDARDSFADRKSQLNRNTFGGTIGGPIRKDRTHFFVSVESMRLRQGFTQNTTVPTPAMRQGDFSALLQTDASNRAPITLFDWTTGAPFAGNIIPRDRMHPLPLRFIDEFVPLPNRPGIGGILPNANYQSLEPQKTRTDQFIGRGDHVFSAQDRIYGRYTLSDTTTIGPPVWPAFGYSHELRGQHAVLNWSRILTPSTINEFRAGYSRFVQFELVESAFKRDVAQELGLKGTCRVPECWHAPYFSVQDFSLFGNPSGQTLGQGVSGPRGWKDEIFQIHESLLLVRGNHTLRLGFTGNRYRDTFPEAIRPVGEHQFNGQWTAGPGSRGFALADAYLGLPRRILASIDIFDPNFRNSQVMPWIQDDWKVTRRLTLNLGLRYEWIGRLAANRDAISNFYQSGPGQAQIITPTDKPSEIGRALQRNDNNNFAPRFGFAFQLTDKTVMRGAYGVFYQRVSSQAAIGMSFNPPFVRTGDVVLGVNESDYRTYPIDDLTPVVNFVAPGSRPSLSGIHVDANDAYIQQWNFYLERMLTSSLVVKGGYVGTKSTGLEIARNPNTPRPGPGGVQERRPFPNLSSVRLFTSDGFASYHGVELTADQRFSSGVSFNGSYTFSRTIDNQGTLDPYNYALDKGLSAFHMAHRFTLAGVFEVPFGRGRRFGAGSPAILNAILGGWQVSPILVLRTGVPLTIGTQGDILNTGGGYTQVPIRLRDAALPKDERSRERFFDTDAFVRPAQYELGNAGRNILIGPGSRNLDLSITKLFTLTESKALQFRAEAFNATNHSNWGNPGTTLGTAAFGTITSNENLPRVLQFGLKFIY
ncbi:MAG: TonB-dependent receptor domain-containing protein, partial [Bryobacteraceae bacterium]